MANGKVVIDVELDDKQVVSGVANISNELAGIGEGLKNVGGDLTKKLTLPIMALAAGVVGVGTDFDTSMSKVEAISGATGAELQKLEATAREMGATTRYSASESADALGYMALAGWDTNQMISSLPGVLNLATAGELELAQASDILTDTMSMFGIEADDASRATDVFARAQADSNTSVQQLSEALTTAGPAASAAGNSIEDTAAILGIMANQGLKGSAAGTALNAMYRDLQAAAEDGTVAIGDHAVEVYDAEGNMRDMSDIMRDVEAATADMTDEQRNAAMAQIFQQQSLRGANMLLNEGTDNLFDFKDGLENSSGAAEEMAGIIDDNAAGSLKNLWSAVQEVGLAFWEIIEGPFRDFIDTVTEIVRWFGQLDDGIQVTIVVIAALLAAIGPVLVIFGTLLGVLPSIVKGFTLLMTGVKLLGGVFALLSGPVGIVIGILTALSVVFILLYDNVEWFRNIVNSVWSFVTSFISQQVSQIITWFNHFRDQGQNIFMAALNAIVATIASGLASGWVTFTGWFAQVLAGIAAWGANLVSSIVSWLAQFTANIASKLAEAASSFISWSTSVISSIIAWGANLVSSIVSALASFASSILSGLATAYSNFTSWISNTISSVVSFGSSLVSTIVSAISSFVSSIVSGLANALSAFTSFISSGISNIVSFGSSIVSTIASAIASFASSVASGLSTALSNITSFVSSGISSIINFASNIVSSIASGMASFTSAIASGASNALARITSFVSSGISAIVNFVSNLISNITSGMSSFTSAISSGASNALSALTSFVSSAISAVVRFASQLISNIVRAMTQFVSRIRSGGTQALSAMRSMLSNIISAGRSFISRMVTVGRDLVRGLVNGIKNMAGAAVNAAKNVVSSAIDGAKSLLGINSPSKVFMQFGEWTSEGLAIGIEDKEKDVVRSVDHVADEMEKAFKPELDTPEIDTADVKGLGRLKQGVQQGLDVTNRLRGADFSFGGLNPNVSASQIVEHKQSSDNAKLLQAIENLEMQVEVNNNVDERGITSMVNHRNAKDKIIKKMARR